VRGGGPEQSDHAPSAQLRVPAPQALRHDSLRPSTWPSQLEAALERAREAAGGRDVGIGGGAATIRQYLRAGLIDELHFAIAPTLLGTGESLFADWTQRSWVTP
jgi:dihydrofolate reductase